MRWSCRCGPAGTADRCRSDQLGARPVGTGWLHGLRRRGRILGPPALVEQRGMPAKRFRGPPDPEAITLPRPDFGDHPVLRRRRQSQRASQRPALRAGSARSRRRVRRVARLSSADHRADRKPTRRRAGPLRATCRRPATARMRDRRRMDEVAIENPLTEGAIGSWRLDATGYPVGGASNTGKTPA